METVLPLNKVIVLVVKTEEKKILYLPVERFTPFWASCFLLLMHNFRRQLLSLKVLIMIAANNNLSFLGFFWVFLYFSKKIRLDISCKSSA